MAGEQPARILHPGLALHQALAQVAQGREQGQGQAHPCAPHQGKARRKPALGAGQCAPHHPGQQTARQAPKEPLPGLLGAEPRGHAVPPPGHAHEVGRAVGRPHRQQGQQNPKPAIRQRAQSQQEAAHAADVHHPGQGHGKRGGLRATVALVTHHVVREQGQPAARQGQPGRPGRAEEVQSAGQGRHPRQGEPRSRAQPLTLPEAQVFMPGQQEQQQADEQKDPAAHPQDGQGQGNQRRRDEDALA